MPNHSDLEKAREQLVQARLLLYQAEIALTQVIDGSVLARGIDLNEVAAQIVKASDTGLDAANTIKDSEQLAQAFGKPPHVPGSDTPDVYEQMVRAMAQANQPATEPSKPDEAHGDDPDADHWHDKHHFHPDPHDEQIPFADWTNYDR